MSTVPTESPQSRPVGHDDDRQFTRTLVNGMALLSCFQEGDAMLANRDFVARTGLTKANVSRLAFTLVTLGFLRLDAASGRYLLGSPVLSMGYPLLASMHIRQIARPYMLEMADDLDATVSLGVRDRSQMLYVETSRGAMSETRLADIGTALPLLGSAMGMAWLAAASVYDRNRAVNQALVAAGYHGRRDSFQRIARGLKDIALDEYASLVDGPSGSLTVAVALRSTVDSEIVVFDCTALQASMPTTDVNMFGRRLMLMARSVEGAMSIR